MTPADEAASAAAPVAAEATAPVAPESPEGFRLEGEMPRVMRLSRKTLAIAGGVAGSAIGGALLWALQPGAPKNIDNLYRADARSRADVVTSAPADYGAVTKLGPPLPGDLGRPILSAQTNGERDPVPPIAAVPSNRPDAAELARQRAEQEHEAARGSRLFLGGGSAAAGFSSGAPTVSNSGGAQDSQSSGSAAPSRRPFLAESGKRVAESSERIRDASSPRILQAGSIIPAALITAIHSDLPGQVTAQVTQNVYDSPTGTLLLIPQGARLIGEYNSEVVSGQNRVLLAWDRLILPGGRSIHLGRQPGADATGKAGLADRTNYHWGQMLGAVLISTLLGVGAELGSDSEDRLVKALREGGQNSFGQTGRQLVERQLAIPPTITIRSGAPLRVIVVRDLVLDQGEIPQ